MKPQRCIIFDLETSGLSKEKHEIIQFDLPFIHELYRRVGAWCPLGFKGLDTFQLALSLEIVDPAIDFGDNHKLENVGRVLGLYGGEVLHDALADVRLNAKVLMALLGRPRNAAGVTA